MKKYDLIIIGSGPGGYTAGEYAAKQGLSTLVIEKENLGGVCLNLGCIPTKALLKSAKIFDYILHADKYGIEGISYTKLTLNWDKILSRKNEVVKQLQNGIAGLLKSAKANLIKGHAKIIDDNTIEINKEKIEFSKLIIATGSISRKLNLPGFDAGYKQGLIISSDEALSLKAIPKTFTVIGGGVIGVEFAILYAELGSKVTILQGVDRILELLDKDISKEVTKMMVDKKINIVTNAKIIEFKNKTIHYEIDSKKLSLKSDVTLVSVGRTPNITDIAELNLEIHNGFIVTNNKMETSKKNIYAIGDCTSKIMLAHVAYKNAMVAVDNILSKVSTYSIDKIPSCIYTFPEVATIGKTEEYLIENNVEYFKAKVMMNHLGKALADGESTGFLKLLVGKKYGEILGCHVIGSTASDIISEISLAMDLECTVYDLSNTIHPHPSISEIIFDASRKIILENFKDKNWHETL